MSSIKVTAWYAAEKEELEASFPEFLLWIENEGLEYMYHEYYRNRKLLRWELTIYARPKDES